MIRKSLNSGNDKNDESRKAMAKMPRPPMLIAKASIQAKIRVIRLQRGILGRFERSFSQDGGRGGPRYRNVGRHLLCATWPDTQPLRRQSASCGGAPRSR